MATLSLLPLLRAGNMEADITVFGIAMIPSTVDLT
jgi:hypothetical protein